jgi:hypothetical protein
VLVVQPRSRYCRYEELAAIRVWTSVSHGHCERSIVSQTAMRTTRGIVVSTSNIEYQ